MNAISLLISNTHKMLARVRSWVLHAPITNTPVCKWGNSELDSFSTVTVPGEPLVHMTAAILESLLLRHCVLLIWNLCIPNIGSLQGN